MRKELFLIFSYIVFFLSPIAAILVATGVLLLAECITGLTVNLKKKDGRTVLAILDNTLSKMFFYFILIILSRIMEVFFIPYIPFASITAGYIAVREFKITVDNIGAILGQDIWGVMVEKFTEFKK